MDKPYIDASEAAHLLGTTRSRVVADVLAGCGADGEIPGKLECLIGTVRSGICVVDRVDLEGYRLAMHRARLSADSSAVQP